MIIVTYTRNGKDFDWLRSNNPKMVKAMVKALKSRGASNFKFRLT